MQHQVQSVEHPSCNVIFVDTSSTYFEVDAPDVLLELDTAGARKRRLPRPHPWGRGVEIPPWLLDGLGNG